MGGGIARPASPLRISVIGVAGDLREFGLAEPAIPEAYYPETQETSSRMVLAVRTANDPQAQVPAIRHDLHDLDILRIEARHCVTSSGRRYWMGTSLS
jgi:hypothetical protein